MEDFYNSTLKDYISNYIKSNTNRGITGNGLKDRLLEIVKALDLGGIFLGFATTSTNPSTQGTSKANGFYFSTQAGTYTNFKDSNNDSLVIGEGLEIIYREVVNNNLVWNHRSIATTVDISGKADKVSGATPGNFAGLDGNGNLTNSGYDATDFVQTPSTSGNEGQILVNDGEGGMIWENKPQNGTDGKDAYHVWLDENGWTGQESTHPVSEYLDSLKAHITSYINEVFVQDVYDDTCGSGSTPIIGTSVTTPQDGAIGNTTPDTTTLDKIVLMPNTASSPSAMMMFVTNEDASLGVGYETYNFVYAGDLGDNDIAFHSGQYVNQVDIVNDLTTGGVNDVLSAEQGKNLKVDYDSMFAVGGVNLFNISTAIFGRKLTQSGGLTNIDDTYAYVTSDFIEIGENQLISLWFYNNNDFRTGSSGYVCCYDENQEYISDSYRNDVGSGGYTTFTDTHYIRVSIQNDANRTNQMVLKGTTKPTGYIPYKLIKSSLLPQIEVPAQKFATNQNLDEVSILQVSGNSENDVMSQKAITDLVSANGVSSLLEPSVNLFDISTAEAGKLKNTGVADSSVSGYVTSGFIEIGANVLISQWFFYGNSNDFRTGTAGVVCCYDENQEYISDSYRNDVGSDGYTTAPGTHYIRVSIQNDANRTNQMVLKGTTAPTEYIPYKLVIKQDMLPFGEDDIDEMVTEKVNEIQAEDAVEIVLPPKINAVKGETIQLFQKGFIKAKNPYIYDVVARVVGYGETYPRYYEVTPSSTGSKTFTVQVKNTNGKVISTKSTNLSIVNEPSNPSSMKHIAIFGASMVHAGVWPAELGRRLNGTGGNPTGAGLTNIRLIGSQGTEDYGYFGMGGWTFENYISKPYLSLRFTVSGVSQWPYTNNNYAIGDVPLRARENNTTEGTILFRVTGKGWWEPNTSYAVGNIVYITQNGSDKIYKCTTAHTSSSTFDSSKWSDVTPSQTGNLVRTDATGGTTPIPYTSYVSESENPLWDNVNDEFSFEPYITQYGDGFVDGVYVQLVNNGLNPANYTTDIELAIAQLTTFADKLHDEYPMCKLFLVGSGMLDEKGSGLNPFLNQQGLNVAIMEKHKAFMDFCDQPEYSSWCEYVDVACQFDTDYSYPTSQKAVNTRSLETETVDSDYVHPNNSGYYLMADAVYRHIVANFCQ